MGGGRGAHWVHYFLPRAAGAKSKNWRDFPEALRDEFDMHEYYAELEVGMEDEKM